jgi:putative hydrolase of the HAD superfamily
VVFDLGGVLAEFSGVVSLRELASIETDDEVWRRWLECEWVRRFERGLCSPGEFASGVVGDWQLPVTSAEFLATFEGWVQAPYDGAEQLVAGTAERVTVAMLSNMNPVHWERAVSGWPLVGHFDQVFTSFQLGLIKPDAGVRARRRRAGVAAGGDLVPRRQPDQRRRCPHRRLARRAGPRRHRSPRSGRPRAFGLAPS